jgi:hypothetical protein
MIAVEDINVQRETKENYSFQRVKTGKSCYRGPFAFAPL